MTWVTIFSWIRLFSPLRYDLREISSHKYSMRFKSIKEQYGYVAAQEYDRDSFFLYISWPYIYKIVALLGNISKTFYIFFTLYKSFSWKYKMHAFLYISFNKTRIFYTSRIYTPKYITPSPPCLTVPYKFLISIFWTCVFHTLTSPSYCWM